MSLFWTTAYGLRTEKAEVGLPTLKDNDITTIHEAFQVLVVLIFIYGAIHKWRHLFFEIFDPSLPLVTHFIK